MMYAHIYAYYRSLFDYDPVSGVLLRKNGQFSGPTGSLDGKGYLMVYVKGKNIRAHRLIWMMYYNEEPPEQIDHKNLNKADNWIDNLRASNPMLNQVNCRKKESDKPYKGVYSRNGKFMAAIYRGSTPIWLKRFATAEEAAKAYNEKAKETWNEHARTNF